jgi:capreomycidine synthase
MTREESPLKLAPALLENWMREYYFTTDFDIGSSGVESFSMAQLRALLGFTHEEIDGILFADSQTLGGAGVRRAIAGHLARGKVDHVIVTHGSTEANFMTMNALLAPGDEVLVLAPCYQQLYGIAEALGCSLRHWPLRFERGWRPDMAELPRLLGPRTRMVVVNFPHNPTGVSLAPEEQRELLAATERAGAYLVWDGAFSELTYDRPPLPEPVDFPHAVSMGTMSKAYGLPGLRVGWCIAAPAILERFVRLRDYTTLHLSPLVEFIAQKAMEKADLLLDLRRAQARSNLEVLTRWAEEHGADVSWVRPDGGVSCFMRFPDRDVDALCLRLAREERVLLVPGSCFGQPAFARLGFGGSRADLEEGLARLSRLLKSMPREVRRLESSRRRLESS